MPTPQTVLRSLRLTARLSPGRWAALGQAAVWVTATRAALAVLPWRRVSAAFERAPVRPGPPDWARAKRTVWAVNAVARRVLPARPCLTQALVARHLLRRQGVETQLQIGAARGTEGDLRAHAWLEHRGRIVIGRIHSDVPYTPFRTAARPAPPPEVAP